MGSPDNSLPLVLRHGAQEGQEAPAERRDQMQVRLIQHLHQSAPGVDAPDDCHAVDHAAVQRSHSASTSTSPVPSALMAFSISGRFLMLLPDALS
jgi:hypothetical protein